MKYNQYDRCLLKLTLLPLAFPLLTRDKEKKLEILGGVTNGLDFLHAHGVLHRDLKPDNVLLTLKSNRPVITDFGKKSAPKTSSGDGTRRQTIGA